MGVEPTSEGITPTHTILKIGEATGPLPPPEAGVSVSPGWGYQAHSMRSRARSAPVGVSFKTGKSRLRS